MSKQATPSKGATPIKSYKNQGAYAMVYCHDHTKEATRGDLEIDREGDEVELKLRFKPTDEAYIFEQCIELARSLAYQLLMEANE